ncbi:MAG: flavin reductase family protein [bacterium]|nr:flavin reductase family protein [bacterium]
MKKIDLKFTNRLINHGPLVVVSARYKARETFTPIAWNMPVEHDPPLVAVCISKENFVNSLIKRSKKFCINILESPYVREILKLGELSGRDGDKLKHVRLTKRKCLKIDVPYLAESSAVIECRLVRDVSLGDVDIFIGRALYSQANEKFKTDLWDPIQLKTIHHLGKNVFATIIKLESFDTH